MTQPASSPTDPDRGDGVQPITGISLPYFLALVTLKFTAMESQFWRQLWAPVLLVF